MPEIAAGGGGTCEESGEGVGSGVCQELICRFVCVLCRKMRVWKLINNLPTPHQVF